MNEFRLNSDASGISLKCKEKGWGFTGLSLEDAQDRMQTLVYSQYRTRKEPVGEGEVSVFVENDPFCLSFTSMITYFPVSVYLTLLAVYFCLFSLPLQFQYPDMIQVYLNVLSGVVFSVESKFSLSYFSMLMFWMLTSGFITLLVVSPLYVVLMRVFGVVPVLVYRFLYYKVLGLFVRTEPSQS